MSMQSFLETHAKAAEAVKEVGQETQKTTSAVQLFAGDASTDTDEGDEDDDDEEVEGN